MTYKYSDYLKELKTTTLFQGIADDDLLMLLNTIKPQIIHIDEGGELPMMAGGFKEFAVFLRGYPQKELAPRRFKYDMPKFGEPGMMMGEIPSLSEMNNTDRPMKKMRFPKGGKGPHGNAHRPAMDVMMMSGESVTKFYNEEVSAAQSKMLRNFLGILAQKVTDIRHDLFIAKDQFDIYGETEKTLNIFTAGCAMSIVRDAADLWTNRHPELPAVVTVGGSVDLIKRVMDGEPCDVLISADSTLFESIMGLTKNEYFVFARNKMVLVSNGKKDIDNDNWIDILCDDTTTFAHFNPYGDPGGYRAVMTLLLADNVQAGLGEKLMNHPGHLGMDADTPFEKIRNADFSFGYYSGAKTSGKIFVEFPAVMDLSDEKLADVYAKAKFAIDDEHTVSGCPITHGIAALPTAEHSEAALDFLSLFLTFDFKGYGFLDK